MFKKIVFLFLFSLIYSITCYSQSSIMKAFMDTHQKISVEQMDQKIPISYLLEDIDFLVKTIEDVHPNPYFFYSKKKFYQDIVQLKKNIQTDLTYIEFYRLIVPLISQLKDGHTSIGFFLNEDIEYLKQKKIQLFPILVKIDNDKIFVIQDLSNPPLISSNEEIKSINGVSTDEFLKKLIQYRSGESDYFRLKNIEDNFSKYLYFALNLTENFYIETETNKKITLKGKTLDELQQRILEMKKSKLQEKDNKLNQEISYSNLGNGIGLITITKFTMSVEDFDQILNTLFLKLKQEKIQHLIIDIRENGGGNSKLGNNLLAYIASSNFYDHCSVRLKKSIQYENFLKIASQDVSEYFSKKPGEFLVYTKNEIQPVNDSLRYKGSVYMLIGPKTFSAAVDFATIFKDFNMGLLIGEETGGFPSSYGDTYPFDLPHSHLFARSSVKYFLRPNCKESTSGLIPDKEVKQSIQDKVSGKDVVLDYTIELIKGNKK